MATEKPFSGQDTLVVSTARIMRHNSLVSNVLQSAQAIATMDSDSEPSLPGKDLACFQATLKRSPGEERYDIGDELGEGGMGAVHVAFDADFLRESAMKVILPELRENAGAIGSFLREARVAAELEHPNIIPVHDIGYREDQGIFFTMKLVRGERLIDILHNLELEDPAYKEKYDFYTLLTIFRKVCDAVAFAHSHNILHRDIKPHNIMVGDYGEVLLMDWGLAKRIGFDSHCDAALSFARRFMPGASTSTENGIIKGSPAYMSPEQASGEPDVVDARSDIFLLGATLYHIFTFFPPYLGDDIYEIIEKAREADYFDPQEMDTGMLDIPEELCQIIKEAMAADPNDRYQSVNDLIAELDILLRGDMHFGERTFSPGEPLMAEGELGSESYMLVSGLVEVRKHHKDGDRTLSTLGPGDIVGEMALITHETRSASVVAVEETKALVLTQEQFSRNLKRMPYWMSKMIVALAERLGEANQRVSDAGI
ncbi:MAG: serine/threonine protein kinase [Rhodothermales bacterium]|jgi:serine/threonine protein kinase